MRIRLLFIFAIFLIISSLVNCNYNQKANPSSRKPPIIQQYEIYGTRAYTTVKAKIYFRGFNENEDRTYPQKVEFNNTLMNNDYLDESKEIETGCPIDNNLPRLRAVQTPKTKADKSVYSLFQEGFQKENKVTITDTNGAQQTYSIYFEPVEFEQPEGIILSRLQDNLVKLKGKGSTKKEPPSFGISQQGNPIDEDLLKFDKERNLLIIPAKALKKLKKGNANFFIITGEGNMIENPGFVSENSYIITYAENICVPIAD